MSVVLFHRALKKIFFSFRNVSSHFFILKRINNNFEGADNVLYGKERHFLFLSGGFQFQFGDDSSDYGMVPVL